MSISGAHRKKSRVPAGPRLVASAALLLFALLFSLRGGAEELTQPTPRAEAGGQGRGYPEGRPPRNVVIVLVDTLRADRLSPFDPTTRVRTPVLERLARRCGVFEQAYAHDNWTKPTVGTVLSGHFPWQHGARSHHARMPEHLPLISERLSAAGFHTGAIVTNGYVSEPFGFRRGWDEWHHSVDSGRSRGELVMEDVEGFLDRRPQSRPFLLYVHTTDPHGPYMPPPDLLRLYDRAPYRGVVDFSADRFLLRRIAQGELAVNGRDRARLSALYDGEVSYADQQVARLLEALSSRGLVDDTMLVFLSDHGEELFERGSIGHGGDRMGNEVVRIPLLLCSPGGSGVRVSAPVGAADLVPTLLDAFGLPEDPALPGTSLLPHLDATRAPPHRPVVIGTRRGIWSVVHRRLKLVLVRGEAGPERTLLYDLAVDPGERRDLSSARPDAVVALRSQLSAVIGLGLAPVGRTSSEVPIDEDIAAQLEALGYMGEDGE